MQSSSLETHVYDLDWGESTNLHKFPMKYLPIVNFWYRPFQFWLIEDTGFFVNDVTSVTV